VNQAKDRIAFLLKLKIVDLAEEQIDDLPWIKVNTKVKNQSCREVRILTQRQLQDEVDETTRP